MGYPEADQVLRSAITLIAIAGAALIVLVIGGLYLLL
jgi:hypothetical protein